MGEKFTEGAITQHLAKLRVKRENIKKQRNNGQGDGSEDSDEAQAQPNKSKRGGKRSIAGTKGSKKSQSAAAKPGPSFKKRNPPRTATRHVIIDTDDELEDDGEDDYEDEEGEYGDSDFPQTLETMAAREQIHNRMRERQSAIREKGKGNASAQRLAQQHDENSETVNQGYGVRDASNDFDITMAERNESGSSVGHDQSQSQSTHTSTSGAGTKTGKSKLVILKLQPHLLQRFNEEPSAGSYVQEPSFLPPATPPQAPCEVRNQNPPRRSQFLTDYNYDAPDVVYTDPLSGYNYPGWDDLPGQYNPQVAPHAPGGNPFYFGPASPSPGALNLAATQAMAAGWSPSPAIGQYIAPIDFDPAEYHREETPPTLRAFMDAEGAGGPAYVDPRMAGIDVPAADMGLPRGMEVEVDSGETETEDSLKWEGEEGDEE